MMQERVCVICHEWMEQDEYGMWHCWPCGVHNYEGDSWYPPDFQAWRSLDAVA